MITKKLTKDLKSSDLPPRNADWHQISLFALTFDREGFPPKFIQSFDADSSIEEIRTYLYDQQRWWNNRSVSIDEESFHKIQEAIELIRSKLNL